MAIGQFNYQHSVALRLLRLCGRICSFVWAFCVYVVAIEIVFVTFAFVLFSQIFVFYALLSFDFAMPFGYAVSTTRRNGRTYRKESRCECVRLYVSLCSYLQCIYVCAPPFPVDTS